MVNLMHFFEPNGFIKPTPIFWFEWFWTVQSNFSGFDPLTILKGWPNQINLRSPVQPIEPGGSVRFLKQCGKGPRVTLAITWDYYEAHWIQWSALMELESCFVIGLGIFCMVYCCNECILNWIMYVGFGWLCL